MSATDKDRDKEHRDRVAQVYFGILKWGAAGEVLRQRIDWMVQHVQGEQILDVGCSEGALEILLARRGCSVTGVDVNADALSFARDLLEREPEEVRTRVRLIQGDMAQVTWPTAQFDTVVIGEVLEHLENPEALLDRSLAFVRPEGRVIITTPFGHHPHNDHHQTFCLSNFVALVKPRCALELLQVEAGYIRMVGRVSSSIGKSWQQLDSDRLIGITETEFLSSQQRLYDNIGRHKDRVKQLESQDDKRKKLEDRLQKKVWDGNIEIVRLQDTVRDKEDELVRLQSLVGETRRGVARLENEITEERGRSAKLQIAVNEERLNAAQLQTQIDEGRRRADQLRKLASEERRGTAQLQVRFNEECRRTDRLQREANEARREAAQLQTQFNEQRRRADRLQKEANEERRSTAQLQEEVNEERQRIAQLRNSIRWQLGTLLVGVARRPWRIVRLPGDMVQLFMAALGRRRRPSTSRATAIEGSSTRILSAPSPSATLTREVTSTTTRQAVHPGKAPPLADPCPLPPSPEPTVDWILDQVEDHRVALIGCDNASLFRSLYQRRLLVTSYDFDSSATLPALIGREIPAGPRKDSLSHSQVEPPGPPGSGSDKLALELDTTIILGIPHRETEIEKYLVCIREKLLAHGSRMVVVLPLSVACPADADGFDLMSILAALRPHTSPEHFSIENDELRFAGRFLEPSPEAWSQFEAKVWPQLMQQAVAILQNRYRRELSSLDQRLQTLLASAAYRAGRVLVSAAKKPWTLWLVPLRLWRIYRASRLAHLPRRVPAARSDTTGAVTFPPLDIPPRRTSGAPLVAAILDTFSEFSLRYELNLLLLSSRHWKRQLEQARPQFLFVESAWAGNNGAWRYMIGDYDRESSALHGLLGYCKERGIRTVFWNKEDPPNFDHFIDAAKEFDFVFTTAAECVPKYRELCGHDRIYVMPFASQPRLHNPCRQSSWRRYPVCFAGSWMEKYPERCKALKQLLDPALPSGLHIFDRNLNRPGKNSSRYRFPDRYQPAVKGSLDYHRMLTAYRCYDVMLNTNSVAGSPTMFSRRVFESLACGTPVISTDSIGLREMLGDRVRTTRSEQDTRRHLNELLDDEERRMREGHLGYRHVHEHHSYRARIEDMLLKIGVRSELAPRASISVIVPTCRPQYVSHALASYAKQCYGEKELVLVLNNAVFDVEAIEAQVDALPNVRILQIEGRSTLGHCLNRGVEVASGDYIARMDDDDHYGERYLSDAMLAARFSEADLLGKGAYFVHVESNNTMALRVLVPEHQFANFIVDATFMARTDVLRDLPFPEHSEGVGAEVLGKAARAGCRIYSSDVFNYLHVRRADPQHHTWQIEDAEFLKKCQRLQSGLKLERVMI